MYSLGRWFQSLKGDLTSHWVPRHRQSVLPVSSHLLHLRATCRHTYPSPCLRASLTKSQQVSSCERSQDASVFLAPADTAARISHNKWSPSSSCKTFSTRNPATGEPLLDFSYATKEDVDRAVKAAREAFQTTWGNNLHATERAACNFCFVWWISVRADACLSDI